MIYHICERAAWQAALAAGRYSAASLAAEGFIHCSTREQALAVAEAFYRGKEDLLLLCIDESRLLPPLRWEAPAHPTAGGGAGIEIDAAGRFPHIYGRVNLDAVVAALDFPQAAGFSLPPGLP